MFKIVGKLLLLALCLSLFASNALAEPSDAKEEAKPITIELNTETEVPVPHDADEKESQGEEKKQIDGEKKSGENGNVSEGSNPAENAQDIDKKTSGEEGGSNWLIITACALLGLFVASCLVFLWNNVAKLSNRVQKVEKKQSNGTSVENNQLEQRVGKIEKELEEIKNGIGSFGKSAIDNPGNQQLSAAQRGNLRGDLFVSNPGRGNFPSNPVRQNLSQLTNTTTQRNAYGTIAADNTDMQNLSEIQKITLEFNQMMSETAKAAGLVSMTIRQKFVEKYHVIAFKCTNYEERVNRPTEQPRFAASTTLEGALWGVPLKDGTLAVLPSLREYEAAAHYQGGMQELFESGYKSGSYRKIEVEEPAVVTETFRIIRRGKLRLSIS